MICPAPDDLREFLNGNAHDELRTQIELHLESCEACQNRLSQWSDDDDLRRWRTDRRTETQPRSPKASSEAELCEEVKQRVLNNDTSVDAQATRTTMGQDIHDQAYLEELTPSLHVGDLGMLGSFRIIEEIGQGGMAHVFRAIDTQLSRVVAIKLLRPERREPLSRERLLHEAKSIAGIRHPHVVAIYGATTTQHGNPYLAMELMEGGSLQDWMGNEGAASHRLLAEWTCQIAQGLEAAHQMGIVHRDIKPSNILLAHGVNESSQSSDVKLADFGLARTFDVPTHVTQTGVLIGTPSYMSPEHIHAPQSVDARSDVYGLGVTMYQLLTGEVPFRGKLAAVLEKVEHGEFPSPRSLSPSIPVDLETICLKAMHREPSRRYLTAGALADDLRRWLEGKPILARPVSSVEKLWRWSQRNPGVASMASVIAALLILMTIGATAAALSIYSSQEKLKAQNEVIRSSSDQVQRSANEAKLQRAVAVESLNSLVTKVQSSLAARPGTIKLREEILTTALEGLDKITRGGDLASYDHTTIEAHLRKSEILDLLGHVDDAAKEIQLSQSLADQSVTASPDSIAARKDLANCLFAQGDSFRKAFTHEKSLPVFQQVLSLRQSILESIPDDVDAERARNMVLQRIADAYLNQANYAQAKVAYEELLTRVLELVQRNPTDPVIQRDQYLVHERLGTMFATLQQLDLAQKHIVAAETLTQTLLKQDADNKLYRVDHAYITRQLAFSVLARGEFALADRLARRAVDLYTALSQEDPSDTETDLRVGTAWDMVYQVQSAAGNWPSAEDALSHSFDRFGQLAKKFPTNTKFASLAMEADFKKADVQSRLGDYKGVIESLDRYMEFLNETKRNNLALPAMQDVQDQISMKVLMAIKLAVADPDLVSKPVDVSDDLYFYACVFAMYRHALESRHSQALALGERIISTEINDPFIAVYGRVGILRACSLCLRDADSAMPLSAEQVSRVLQLSNNAIKPLLRVNPEAKAALAQEPDLRWLLKRPEFHATIE